MERKKIATEIVIHHYGSGLRIAPEILPEFGRVAETLDHPTKSCGELGDRLDLRPGPEQQQADWKRQRFDKYASALGQKNVRSAGFLNPAWRLQSMCGRGKPLAL